MSKVFRDSNGKCIELDRETKVLILKSVYNSDYYKGKNHDSFDFVDNEGNNYRYDATLNADMTEYDSKFAKELAFSEGKHVKLSGYFVPPSEYSECIYIYSPRLLSIDE